MASFMRVSYKLVFHQSKCIGAIKRIHSTIPPRIYPLLLYVFVCSGTPEQRQGRWGNERVEGNGSL